MSSQVKSQPVWDSGLPVSDPVIILNFLHSVPDPVIILNFFTFSAWSCDHTEFFYIQCLILWSYWNFLRSLPDPVIILNFFTFSAWFCDHTEIFYIQSLIMWSYWTFLHSVSDPVIILNLNFFNVLHNAVFKTCKNVRKNV